MIHYPLKPGEMTGPEIISQSPAMTVNTEMIEPGYNRDRLIPASEVVELIMRLLMIREVSK